ncbi:MAG: hypothetical protein JWN95_2349 [Frankiales bacterium]|nr:hypothetical protein [Frankiales bacterium]
MMVRPFFHRRWLIIGLSLVLATGGSLAAAAHADSVSPVQLTMTSSAASVVSGAAVTLSGVMTSSADARPVVGARVNLSLVSAIGSRTLVVTTNDAGLWRTMPVIIYTTTVTAYPVEYGYLAAPALTVAAQAQVSLALATATASRPYLLDAAKVTVRPSGAESGFRLQTRVTSTARWTAAADQRGVWGGGAGRLQVRAVTIVSSLAAAGVSNIVTVMIGKDRMPAWLIELNAVRALYGAGKVAEDRALSVKDALHVRYMSRTGDYAHTENPRSKWHTVGGAQAGLSSDLMQGSSDPVQVWATAPFHALAMMDRTVSLAGYANDGSYSALWPDSSTSTRSFGALPATFPASGTTASLSTYWGLESPEPLTSCPAAWRNAANILGGPGIGLPLIASLAKAPTDTAAQLVTGRSRIPVCVITESTYRNADRPGQALGREILAEHHSVLIIPLRPLAPKHTYVVTVTTSGHRVAHWGFRSR